MDVFKWLLFAFSFVFLCFLFFAVFVLIGFIFVGCVFFLMRELINIKFYSELVGFEKFKNGIYAVCFLIRKFCMDGLNCRLWFSSYGACDNYGEKSF